MILIFNILVELKMVIIEVNSLNVFYISDFIQFKYVYQNIKVDRDVLGNIIVIFIDIVYLF